MAKANQVIDSRVDGDTITFFVAGAGQLAITLSELNDAVKEAAMLHGLRQKIADAAAIPRNTETGKSATAEEKLAAMTRVRDRLVGGDGEWNSRGEGDGTSGASLLARALAEATGRTLADMVEEVKKMDKKTQAAMRADKVIAPIVARIKSEDDGRAGKGVDTKALLGSLMHPGGGE